MKKLRLLTLTMSLFSMLVTSCATIGKYETPITPENTNESEDDFSLSDEEEISILNRWNPVVHVVHDENFFPEFDEMEPVPSEDRTRLSSSMLDTPLGTTVSIVFQDQEQLIQNNAAALSRKYEQLIYGGDVDSYISITDVDNTPKDALLNSDGERITLSLDESFAYGEIYFISLQKENTLMFEGKDPSIQRLTIEIEDDPNEPAEISEMERQENIPLINLDNISNEDVDENSEFSFEYDGTFPALNEGDVFLAKSNQANDNIEMVDFYGQFIRKEQIGNDRWKVYYQEPDSEKVYKKLRQKSVQPIDFSNVEILVSEENIQNEVRYSTISRGLLSFFAKQARTKDPEILGGIIESIHFDFTFNYYDGKFTFSFAFYVNNIEIYRNKEGTAALYLTLKYEYSRVTEYHIDFDVGLKKKWFVPVGISYKVKMVEDISEAHTFYVIINGKAIQDTSEEKIKNDLADELNKAKAGEDNFFKKVSSDPDAKQKTEGNKTTIPLFQQVIPVYAPLVFQIRMDFIIDFTVEAMFFVRKQWKSNRVVLNFSNKDGGDSDTHQDVKEASAWDVYFMGLAEAKISFRLSGALYFEGTYKYLHVELYAELYIKVGLQGNIAVTFTTNTSGSITSTNISIDFYIQMGAKAGVDIVLAIFDFDFSVDLFKTYILRICFTNALEHYAEDAQTEINLNQTIASLDEFDVLKFRIWDGVRMVMDVKKLPADGKVKLIESWFGDIEFDMFTYEVKDEYKHLLDITKEGVIQVHDGTDAEFDAVFTIKISNLAGFVGDRDITIHFSAPDAHHIYIKDDNTGEYVDMGKYRPEHEYKLPLPEERGGYRFLNYIVHFPGGDTEMYIGETFPMIADQDLYIDINWHKIVYYSVFFYDGHNNLVYADYHVEEYMNATEPDPEIRDQYMDGYFFVGWDKSIAHVTSDLVVRGIYIKVGD